MKVVIIGSGNVATVLGKKIFAAGHEVIEVVSRSLPNAQTLARLLHSKASENISEVDPGADIYLLCVGDGAIEKIVSDIPFDDKIFVHTAGAVSKSVLALKKNYGVVYPLQSLRKEMEILPEIPVLIDGSSKVVAQIIFDFAASWASSVSFATDEERLKLHVAAVFSSNFTNHLYAITEDFCRHEKVDFKKLLPLIKETAGRLEYSSPSTLQTGPAVRNDLSTIRRHLEVLSSYPNLAELYNQLSNSIIDHHKTGPGN